MVEKYYLIAAMMLWNVKVSTFNSISNIEHVMMARFCYLSHPARSVLGVTLKLNVRTELKNHADGITYLHCARLPLLRVKGLEKSCQNLDPHWLSHLLSESSRGG